MLAIEDRSKKNKANGGQFLVTRPETVSNEIKQAKSKETRERQQKAAEDIYNIANKAIVAQNAPEPVKPPEIKSNKNSTFGSMFTSGAILRGFNAVNNVGLLGMFVPTVNFQAPEPSKSPLQPYVGGQFSNVRQSVSNAYSGLDKYYVNKLEKEKEKANGSTYGAMGRLQGEADNRGKTNTSPYALDWETHNQFLEDGQAMKDDLALLGDYNSLDKDHLENYDDKFLEDLSRRIERDEKYYNDWTRPELIFDTQTGEWVETRVYKKGAPLPPWVQPTRRNAAAWDYYLGYQDVTFSAQKKAASEAHAQVVLAKKYGYKSAMSENDGIGVENSLIDAVIADIRDTSTISNKTGAPHTIQYLKDYMLRPAQAHKYKTLMGNVLVNLGDIMDTAARGERAILAARKQLGGWYDEGHSGYENQNLFWINLPGYRTDQLHDAQRVFIQSGGLSLLNRDERLEAKISDVAMSFDEREKYIAEQFEKAGIVVPWEDVRDAIKNGYYSRSASEQFTDFIKQARRNLNKTYSLAGYDFNADTGDLVSDIVIEVLSDPGLLAGGISKAILKGGVKTASKRSILSGLQAAGIDGDSLSKIFHDKKVQKAMNHLSKVDDGKNIIFRRAESLRADVKILADTLDEAKVFRSGLDKVNFEKAALASLVEQGKSMNTNIIANSPKFQKMMDNKMLKTAYYVDHGIDKIDTLLLKTSFAAPFIMADTFKLLKKGLAAGAVGKFVARKMLTNGEVVQALVKGEGKGIRCMTENLVKTVDASNIAQRDLMRGVKKIRSEFDSVVEAIDRTTKMIQTGKLSIQDATSEVDAYIRLLSNGDFSTIDEIEEWIETLSPVYRKEYGRGLDAIKAANARFNNYIDMFNSKANEAFLNEVQSLVKYVGDADVIINDINDLRAVFEKYAGQIDFEYIRKDIEAILGSEMTNEFINSTQAALKSGILISNDDVAQAIVKLQSAENVSTKVQHRSISVTEFKKVLPSELNNVLSKNSQRWMFNDLNKLLRSRGELNYSNIYDAIDHTLYKVSYAYTKKPTDELKGVYSQLLALQDAIRNTDYIATNSVDTLNSFHLDLYTSLQGLLHDAKMREMLDDYYNKMFSDVFKELDSLNFSDLTKEEQDLYCALSQLRSRRNSIDLYEKFELKINNITGMTNMKAYAICSAILTNYSGSRNALTEITRNPNGVLDFINEILFNTYGGSKLNMKAMRSQIGSLLTSKPDEFFKNSRFIKELEDPENEIVRKWLTEKIAKNMDDPQAYADMQMLTVLMMHPDEVRRLNKMLDEGETPIFLHLSTTGLNTDADTITAIGYRKWKRISDPDNISLKEIYEMFSEDEVKEFRVRMTDEEINKISHSTLKALYSSEDVDVVLRERFSKLFRCSDDLSDVKSEGDILEEFFKFLYDDQIAGQGKRKVIKPYHFVVHDLQSSSGANGFNMRMLNSRAQAYAEDFSREHTSQYANGLALSSKADNTLNSFRNLIDDNGLTNDQFFEVERAIREYAIELHKDAAAANYHLLDFTGYVDDSISIHQALRKFKVSDDTSEWVKTLLKNDAENKLDVQGVMQSINSVQAANDIAKQYIASTRLIHDKRVGSVSFSVEGFAEHMNQECFRAFEGIASLFGIDLTSTLLGADTLGMSLSSGTEILINPYYQSNISEVLMHELRHNWVVNDSAREIFNNKIKYVLAEALSSGGDVGDGVNRAYELSRLIPDDPSITDALEKYVKFISDAYPEYVPLSDDWMDEFVAPIFEYMFANVESLDSLKHTMIKKGFEATMEGKQALDFIDYFGTIMRNADELRNWSRLSQIVDISDEKHIIKDCLYRITNDSELLDELSDSILNAVINKDELQSKVLNSALRTNPVREARAGLYAPNILNVSSRQSIEDVRRFYALGDSIPSEAVLLDSGATKGLVAPNGMLSTHELVEHSLYDLEKMNANAQYLIRVRANDITSNASILLEPYSVDASDFIEFIRDFVINNSDLTGVSSFNYLQYTKISSDYVDNFLMCQKIYDDVFKLLELEGLESSSEFLQELGIAFDEAVKTRFSEDFISVLDGELDLRIYKSGHVSDEYARRFYYTVGSFENELEKARNYRNAMHEIASNINQREHASLRLKLNGIRTQNDSRVGQAWQSVLNALNAFSGRVRIADFQETTKVMSRNFYNALQNYRLERLRIDGVFDEDRILSELLWNGHNHIAFQTANYSADDIDALIKKIDAMREAGKTFISWDIDETTNKLYVYLNNSIDVYRDTSGVVEKRYYVFKDGKYSRSYVRPEYDNLHRADILQIGDAEDSEHLIRAWQNIDILSGGLSRGTSGRVLSQLEIEHYYNTLPSFMKDMASPKNMLNTTAEARLIYDPGFIIEGETDYFLDMLDTMRYQTKVMNNGTATLAYMFGNGAQTRFSHIMRDVTDDEIIKFFSRDSDFVVAVAIPNKNMVHGVEIKQLKMDTYRAIEYARSTDNAVILPYDIYMSVLDDININTNPVSVRSTLNHALLLMKAFQLCNVGSWVRNWYDATKKAAMDMGETPSNVWTILMYQGKSIKDFGTFRKILKSYDGYVDGYSWGIIQKTFNTDMTYEDFVILSNMFHSSSTILNTKYFKHNNWQKISGLESGVKGLSEKDINDAFVKTYPREKDSILSKELFINIHQGRVIPTETQRIQYEDMIREIDTHLRSTRLSIMPEKATNIIFHPFSLSENIVRYAQTQYLRDYGMTESQISKRIHMTQFNTKRATASGYLEYAIPYVNYSFDNVMYWIRMIEDNPRYFKYFADTYGNMVSSHIEDLLDKGQEFDIERDNMVKTGGVPIGHNGMYFKLNPSFMDFVNNMYGGWPNITDHLNPLLNIALRGTLSEFGYGSKYFFSELDLNISEDDVAYDVSSITPGVNKIYSYYKAFKRANDYFGDEAGMPTKVFFTVFSSLFGLPVKYGDGNKGSFDEWQEDLAKQGKWFDCNRNRIVDLDQRNFTGANNPENTWDDTRAYMLVHFGKVWDGNQGKWVNYWEYTSGGFNEKFDFDNDPTAWDRLCALYESIGKVYDYNVGKFVYKDELSDGDLNDPDITWEERCELMYEKFGKVWDANRNRSVEEKDLLLGGLNDSNLNGKQKAALRLALFGKVWNDVTKQYDYVQEPSVVLFDSLIDDDDTANKYYLLGIPRLEKLTGQVHVNNDGILVTKDGKKVLLKDPNYNAKVFKQITDPYAYTYHRFGKWRNFSGWYNRNYSKFTKFGKQPKVFTPKNLRIHRSYNPYISQTGFGWNADKGQFLYGYRFRLRFSFSKSRVKRTVTRHVHYPYGGGYNKFSFYMR